MIYHHTSLVAKVTFGICLALAVGVSADGEILVAEAGGVQIWTIPQPPPLPGFWATIVELRTVDPNAAMVTFANVQFEGRVHQTWLGDPFGGPTPGIDNVTPGSDDGTVYGDGWAMLDTHLLVSNEMLPVAPGGAPSFGGLTETNDGSTTASDFLGLAEGQYAAKTGFGELGMPQESDAFFLKSDAQTNILPWAYVVTDYSEEEGPGEVFMSVGVLGPSIIDAGVEGGAAFGYAGNDRVLVTIELPEPSSNSSLIVVFCIAVGQLRRCRRA